MQKVTKNVDALGFDKWQIADVRRAYASNKATYTKLKRVSDKITALGAEYDSLMSQLEAWEGPVKIITQKVLGVDLTSQEVLAYHANPNQFALDYPDHPKSAELLAASGSGTPAEDPATEPETTESAPAESAPAESTENDPLEF